MIAMYEEIERLKSVVEAQTYSLGEREKIIDRVIKENSVLTEALRKLLLAVLSRESMRRRGLDLDLEPEIERARAVLESIN